MGFLSNFFKSDKEIIEILESDMRAHRALTEQYRQDLIKQQKIAKEMEAEAIKAIDKEAKTRSELKQAVEEAKVQARKEYLHSEPMKALRNINAKLKEDVKHEREANVELSQKLRTLEEERDSLTHANNTLKQANHALKAEISELKAKLSKKKSKTKKA